MIRWVQVVFLFFLFYTPAAQAANYIYNYDHNCSEAYQQFMSLHIDEGRASIVSGIKSNPYNLMNTYIADYEDCVVLLLNCDKAVYSQRKEHLEARVELLEKGDGSSPWYRFCLGGLYLHWALVNTRFGETYKAAVNFHKSYSLLKENSRLFPKFEYNTVFTSLQEAVIGCLPGNYKWMASIFGVKGDLKKGVRQLGLFVGNSTSQQPLYLEAKLYYVYTRFYLLNEQKEVWEVLNSPQFEVKNNLLNTFVKTNIALDYRKADAAVEALRTNVTAANYLQYPILNYQMGCALFNRIDTACAYYFEQYIAADKSGLLIKDSWEKAALCWYLNNHMPRANYCREKAKQAGNMRTDADKQASKMAAVTAWPQRNLLTARLLIEGGYYTKAIITLQQINEVQLSVADNLEYNYRYGKACQEEGDDTRAIAYYQTAIAIGKDRHEQFAARAALQIGIIYEHEGMPAKAQEYYNQSLDMPAHDFQNSIDQQAKAGINRVDGH